MNKLLKFLWFYFALFPLWAFGGATSSPPAWTYPGAANITFPVVLIAKNISLLTSGAPADLIAVPIPAGITRWKITATGLGICVAESAAGTLAGAAFTLFDSAGGTGVALGSISTAPAAATPSANSFTSVNANAASTGSCLGLTNTLYIRQTTNSANAGVVSFYVLITVLN